MTDFVCRDKGRSATVNQINNLHIVIPSTSPSPPGLLQAPVYTPPLGVSIIESQKAFSGVSSVRNTRFPDKMGNTVHTEKSTTETPRASELEPTFKSSTPSKFDSRGCKSQVSNVGGIPKNVIQWDVLASGGQWLDMLGNADPEYRHVNVRRCMSIASTEPAAEFLNASAFASRGYFPNEPVLSYYDNSPMQAVIFSLGNGEERTLSLIRTGNTLDRARRESRESALGSRNCTGHTVAMRHRMVRMWLKEGRIRASNIPMHGTAYSEHPTRTDQLGKRTRREASLSLPTYQTFFHRKFSYSVMLPVAFASPSPSYHITIMIHVTGEPPSRDSAEIWGVDVRQWWSATRHWRIRIWALLLTLVILFVTWDRKKQDVWGGSLSEGNGPESYCGVEAT
ncbi:hypothetical protein B0H34DRAFT_809688 [Crassisporium funariophilum]|nr:hypothetical protein B0H34DRAFT_809688 [Crassisporium funariophilum]